MTPAVETADGWSRWLWMFTPESANRTQRAAFLTSDRYSAADIALEADQDRFHERRAAIRAAVLRRSAGRLFVRESPFSAADLEFALERSTDASRFVRDLLTTMRERAPESRPSLDDFTFCRIAHTLGSACEASADRPVSEALPGLRESLDPAMREWMEQAGIALRGDCRMGEWARNLHALAFQQLNSTVLRSSLRPVERPSKALRPDENDLGARAGPD